VETDIRGVSSVEALAEHDPFALATEYGRPRPTLRLVVTSDAEAITPELALVCPELRQRAIDALVERDPDGFLPPRRPPKPAAAAVDRATAGTEAVSRRELAVGAAAYLAIETAHAAVSGVLAVGGVAGLATLATIVHGG
jgi:hypothetical protein